MGKKAHAVSHKSIVWELSEGACFWETMALADVLSEQKGRTRVAAAASENCHVHFSAGLSDLCVIWPLCHRCVLSNCHIRTCHSYRRPVATEHRRSATPTDRRMWSLGLSAQGRSGLVLRVERSYSHLAWRLQCPRRQWLKLGILSVSCPGLHPATDRWPLWSPLPGRGELGWEKPHG